MHCIDRISIELTIEMCIRSKSAGTRSDVGDSRNFKEAYCLGDYKQSTVTNFSQSDDR